MFEVGGGGGVCEVGCVCMRGGDEGRMSEGRTALM